MLARLLEAGHEVTFLRGDGASAGRAFECHLITPEGNGVTACGATPAAALAGASPLEAAAAPGFTVAERLASLEIWADAAAGRLAAIEAAK